MNMPLGTLDRRPPPFFKQGPSALTRMLFYSALSVVLMVADTHFRLTGPVRSAISVVLYPVEQFTLAPVRWARSFNGYLDGLKSAQAQRDAAQRQLVAQAQDVLRMTQLEQENAQLRQLLGLRPRLRVSARAAEVLYETTDPYSERIVIDRGSTQGVRLGSPVIDDHGVLGQVTRVYPLTAEVTLLTDKDAAIPVINGRTKERVIAFGKPDATADEIVRAAQTVGAHDFILRLEDGYETQLGERGSRLSLGQRQLIAFARALLADPRILILDEATSSVDIGTERKIERALHLLLEQRTAFIIAHRLSTIRDADLIVVLEHGRVVEQGSHEELLAARGLYTSLYGDWASDAA